MYTLITSQFAPLKGIRHVCSNDGTIKKTMVGSARGGIKSSVDARLRVGRWTHGGSLVVAVANDKQSWGQEVTHSMLTEWIV